MNTMLTNAEISKRVLLEWLNEVQLLKDVDKQYSGEFAKSGAKIGQTINVKLPNRYKVQQGPVIVPQGTTENTVPLTLNRYYTVPMSFSGAERVLSIDKFAERYIKPAVNIIASNADLECHTAAITGNYPVANSLGVTSCPGAGPVNFVIGTPGTTPGTSGGSALLTTTAPTCFLNAGVILDNNATPNDGKRNFILNPSAQGASIGALSGLFNPQGVISQQYMKGRMGNALNFNFLQSQNVYAFTAGSRVASGVDTVDTTTAAFGTAGTSSTTVAYTAGAGNNTKTLAAGDSFTIAGIYAVNPQNQQNTGILYQFVVTEAITLSTGANTVKVSPYKVAGSGVADGNIVASSTGASAAVVFTSGAASTVSPQNLAYHPDAFTFGSADLELPQNAGGGALMDAYRENKDGVSMRIATFWDGMSDSHVTRVDLLCGFSVQRPEWSVRLAG